MSDNRITNFNVFGNPGDDPRMQRQMLLSRYYAARSNLLFLVIFTAVNILLLATNSGIYFLFSATIPYIIVDLGMFLCGKYPDDWYEGFEGMMFVDDSFYYTLLAIAILILVIYLLLWFFSKNQRVGFIIGALVLFAIDTAAMLYYYGLSGSSLFDILFHIWVIVILAMGISAHYKLKKLPEEPIEAEFTELPTDGGNPSIPDSTAIRPAATDVKFRVLLEEEVFGHKVTYRRLKKTNELVIDGDVYSEYTAVLEMPHMLTANVGGHSFAVGMDQTASRSYMTVDGRIVRTKMRWY